MNGRSVCTGVFSSDVARTLIHRSECEGGTRVSQATEYISVVGRSNNAHRIGCDFVAMSNMSESPTKPARLKNKKSRSVRSRPDRAHTAGSTCDGGTNGRIRIPRRVIPPPLARVVLTRAGRIFARRHAQDERPVAFDQSRVGSVRRTFPASRNRRPARHCIVRSSLES